MSLAGPHGEAACKYCGTLQDLDHEGLFRYHNVPPSVFGPRPCPGSKERPEGLPKELESLAFSSEPIFRRCPVCGVSTEVTTIGQHRSNWRFQSHYRKSDRPTSGWCPGTGTPVGYGKEDGVTVSMAPVDENGEVAGEYQTLDGVTLNLAEPFAQYEGF